MPIPDPNYIRALYTQLGYRSDRDFLYWNDLPRNTLYTLDIHETGSLQLLTAIRLANALGVSLDALCQRIPPEPKYAGENTGDGRRVLQREANTKSTRYTEGARKLQSAMQQSNTAMPDRF